MLIVGRTVSSELDEKALEQLMARTDLSFSARCKNRSRVMARSRNALRLGEWHCRCCAEVRIGSSAPLCGGGQLTMPLWDLIVMATDQTLPAPNKAPSDHTKRTKRCFMNFRVH